MLSKGFIRLHLSNLSNDVSSSISKQRITVRKVPYPGLWYQLKLLIQIQEAFTDTFTTIVP